MVKERITFVWPVYGGKIVKYEQKIANNYILQLFYTNYPSIRHLTY